jgi:hypothetical protein
MIFQRALQWVLHDLNAQTWDAFMEANRGQYSERVFIRVGSFINRVSYLVKYRLLGAYESILLDNLASSTIEVWRIKIEPLVLDARQTVNAKLFQDFQEMKPECYGYCVPRRAVGSRGRQEAPGTVLKHTEISTRHHTGRT